MPANIEQALRAAANQYSGAQNPKPAPPPIKERPADPVRVAKANTIRKRLKDKFPTEFADGERCALFQKSEGSREPGGYPKGFHQWPLARRNSWWAGYNLGRCERLEKPGESR